MIRFLDIILASISLAVGIPVLFVLAVLGWLETRKPLFWQQRIGLAQKPFTLVKFRSMRAGAESVPTHLADVSAVTPLGRFLRRSKLDELPQLWNVLRGEMSLVGPRPCLPSQYELIAARESLGVFCVRPGVTGLSQLRGIDMSTPQLLAETDAEMIRSFGLKMYVRCIVLTVLGHGMRDSLMPQNN